MEILFTNKGAAMSASQDVAEQVVRAAPTASVAVLTWMTNIPVNLLVQWVALIFGILQVYVLVRDRIVAPWIAKRQTKPDAPANPSDGSA